LLIALDWVTAPSYNQISLEECLAKDSEKMPSFDDVPLQPAEPQGFSFEQMIRCDDCLRANPPTRVNCLYCSAVLPTTEASAALQKPILRKLEKWEQGYNNILRTLGSERSSNDLLSKVASLLRLTVDDVSRILITERPLPLARAATLDEASLIERKLRDLGIETVIVSDCELGLGASLPQRVRALEFSETEVVGYHFAGAEAERVPWSGIALVAAARLFVKRIEIRERRSRKAEDEILDASEITTDEAVMDLYTETQNGGWRIAANSFDFSCLQSRKALLATENFSTLISVIRERAPQAEFDDSYNTMRQSLEPVWPSDRQTEARGWRRDRPGKYSTGEVTTSNNESQFTRYSRLQHYLRFHPLDQPR
jgi:hypothetical protein